LEQIDKWKDALFIGDVDIVGRQAHSIKGAAGNICSNALQESALQAEKSGKESKHTLNILWQV